MTDLTVILDETVEAEAQSVAEEEEAQSVAGCEEAEDVEARERKRKRTARSKGKSAREDEEWSAGSESPEENTEEQVRPSKKVRSKEFVEDDDE